MKCMMNLPERYVCVLFSKLFYSGNVERYDTIYSFITARLIPQIIPIPWNKKTTFTTFDFLTLYKITIFEGMDPYTTNSRS